MSFPIEIEAAALAQTLRRIEPDVTAELVDGLGLLARLLTASIAGVENDPELPEVPWDGDRAVVLPREPGSWSTWRRGRNEAIDLRHLLPVNLVGRGLREVASPQASRRLPPIAYLGGDAR